MGKNRPSLFKVSFIFYVRDRKYIPILEFKFCQVRGTFGCTGTRQLATLPPFPPPLFRPCLSSVTGGKQVEGRKEDWQILTQTGGKKKKEAKKKKKVRPIPPRTYCSTSFTPTTTTTTIPSTPLQSAIVAPQGMRKMKKLGKEGKVCLDLFILVFPLSQNAVCFSTHHIFPFIFLSPPPPPRSFLQA